METIESARERVAKAAERDGEIIFARQVRAGAWDHRDDVKAALRGERLKGEPRCASTLDPHQPCTCHEGGL